MLLGYSFKSTLIQTFVSAMYQLSSEWGKECD